MKTQKRSKDTKRNMIEISSGNLCKNLETLKPEIAELACKRYLVKRGFDVIRIT